MRRLTIILILSACGTTRDSGCGGRNNTDTAETHLRAKTGATYTCITDGDDGEYLCSPEGGDGVNYRCADSASASSKIKCIRWFPTE